jgi:hypothetical protein
MGLLLCCLGLKISFCFYSWAKPWKPKKDWELEAKTGHAQHIVKVQSSIECLAEKVFLLWERKTMGFWPPTNYIMVFIWPCLPLFSPLEYP